jgi:energy-coupling factor transporter transmembrane protein EcfT
MAQAPITNSLRHADDIVTAAEARAFSTSRARPLSITRRQGDYLLAAALIVVAILLVL